ncbi:sodium-dependent phosphate transporter 2-like isoform X2 [Xenia sp. Carnegie-2017]|uniref:sodium-dependent phosphate transporter 2-like isoform X2 n=1 Tax=Xenia sp. Carnegie-2017 TaxID=2897299 RepID=UPI001F0366AF|nr:sodium-dependent phosphate transporter 2-like isoform X2 [Xenia sp. Carnegie-2017]
MDNTYLWIVVLGFIIAFILALGLGANDVANSFGTSVGSKVLTLRNACIVATICETAGAVLAGGKVTDTIRSEIVDIDHSGNDTECNALIGSLSALCGGALWLITATIFKLPVSSTHSIVGAMMGFGIVAYGAEAIKWKEFAKIVSSWVISPLMSGLISSCFYVILQYFVLKKNDSYHAALKALPVIYFIVISINVFAIFYDGSHVLHFNKIPLYGCFILSFGIGTIVALLIAFLFVPYMKQKIDGEFEMAESNSKSLNEGNLASEVGVKEKTRLLKDPGKDNSTSMLYSEGPSIQEAALTSEHSSSQTGRNIIADEPKTSRLLAYVQILTASSASFAHGSNDVSNAIGPLVTLWLTYRHGNANTEYSTPLWILFYGGAGISIGLLIWGRRVIETVGENLSTITPSSGLIIEFGTVCTVLFASNLGIPISTTHCLVGAIIMVGLVRSRHATDWRVFINIVVAWLVTVPASGLFSAGIYALLSHIV